MPDALAQFKQLPKEPQLWERENTEQENAEYNKPLKTSLDDQKKELMVSLYWWKTEQADNTTETTEQVDEDREANKQRAEQLFYNPETIESIIKSSVSEPKEQEVRLERFNSDSYQEDLEIIMWNFSTQVEGASLSEIYEKWGAWASFEVNEALNVAFKMQIEVVLDWKMNYSREQVDKLLVDLSLWDPFEKLDIFEEIKSIVNQKEWAWWRKQDMAFRKMKAWVEAKAEALEQKFNDWQMELEIAKQEWNQEQIQQLLTQGEDLKQEAENSGDVFIAWEIDKLTDNIKSGNDAA